MSTRSNMIVEGNEGVVIYKHSDGYPSNVMRIFKKILPAFKAKRGFDPCYLPARILHANMQEEMHEYIPSKDGKSRGKWKRIYDYRKSSMLSNGISVNLHGDIQYLYIIHKDFSVEIRVPVNGFWDNPLMINTNLLRTYTLAEIESTKKFSDE
jgi:hypothetical protein